MEVAGSRPALAIKLELFLGKPSLNSSVMFVYYYMALSHKDWELLNS